MKIIINIGDMIVPDRCKTDLEEYLKGAVDEYITSTQQQFDAIKFFYEKD